MTESWWPKPPYHNDQDPALSVGYEAGVQAAMEAVAQRMAEKELVFFESYFKPDGIQDKANRRFLGLERKAG